jgi:hypothetical protein
MNDDYFDLLIPEIDASIEYYLDIMNTREQ